MKKTIISAAIALQCIGFAAKADEGMWIPSLIGKNYAEMQKLGLKLSASDIYNINKSSVKDAIVSLGFCTGEIISPEGLFLTNHHCAYSSIQFNSAVDHDYLKNGFWAKAKDQELPSANVTASILQQIVDVTTQIQPLLKGLDPTTRSAKIKELEAKLGEEYTKQGYTVQAKEMFYGNQFFLYVYEKFTDVRLVGAPPESIGKFGGDTDNWMWPRHTGDFSLMRIYANKDNKPAAYSKENVPYKPKHFLPVSINGIQEGDYTMILGFPGRTNRYASSYELQNAIDNVNPAIIELYGKRLEVMKKDMDANPEIRIKLAAKYASMANSWKYYIGQNQGLKRLKIVETKRADESSFMKWVNTNTQRKAQYATILPKVDSAYKAYRPNFPVSLYYRLGATSAEAVGFASQFIAVASALKKTPADDAAIKAASEQIKSNVDAFYKDYSATTDKKVFAELLILVNNHLPDFQKPSILKNVVEGKNDAEQAIREYANNTYNNSIFTDKQKVEAYLANPSLSSLENDPLYQYTIQTNEDLKKALPSANSTAFNSFIDRQKELYIAGQMEMQNGKNFYPDANSSLRLTYGKVADYKPADAIEYDFYTTTDGILQKEDNTNAEFEVPAKLHDLISQKDFGRYADKNGKMHVAFLHTTDITGGNSGSPVINAKGELVGTAFDGNWEAMTGDLVFDAKFKRTISVDVRYVLFIIDKFAGAQNLINEMKIVGTSGSVQKASKGGKMPAKASKR